MRFRAAYGYLPGGQLLENAVLDVDPTSGLICELRPVRAGEELPGTVDLGQVLIAPGLLNAHCHLEYSALKGQIASGLSFTSWIKEIVRLKTAMSPDELCAQLPAALAELTASGVTTLADNLSLDLTASVLRAAPLRAVLLFECLDFLPENSERAFAALLDRIAKAGELAPGECGFAPHGPHSVSPALLTRIAHEAASTNRTVSIHAAETREEVEFFLKGSGPIAQLKREFGTLPEDWTCPHSSPIRHLAQCGALSGRTLLIHATHPQPGDIKLIAQAGSSVVYCPGTHRFFKRGPYPFGDYLKAGINLCIGTDSLASNESLDLMRELRLARRAHPATPASSLIDTVTRFPARALGLIDRGSLEPGKLADLSVWDWPYRCLEEWLEDDQPHCTGVYLGGIKVNSAHGE